MYSTYILYSSSLKKYYIGSTQNIDDRLKRHNAGRSTYTRRGMPWILVYQETYETRQEAYKRELRIKSYKGGIQFKELISGGIA